MAERKVQSKYYPPDYNPKLLAKLPKADSRRKVVKETVRLMIPFNIQCAACNAYMYRGRKFNARKEVSAEEYMGTHVVHFKFKCEGCKAEICFRTDPASSGFAMVSGGRENVTSAGMHNPLAGIEDPPPDAEETTQADALSSLEARAAESKKEMEDMDDLDRELDRRNARARGEELLFAAPGALVAPPVAVDDDKEEEESLRAAFDAKRRRAMDADTAAVGGLVDDGGGARTREPVIKLVAKRRKPESSAATTTTTTTAPQPAGNLLGGDYSDSD